MAADYVNASQETFRNASNRRSHSPMRFQLLNVWLTALNRSSITRSVDE